MSTPPGWSPATPEWVRLGSIQGPPGDTIVVVPYTMTGPLLARPGAAPYPITGGPYDVLDVTAAVGTAPSGTPVRVDVNVDGATIYADQTHRPSIAPGTRLGVGGAPSVSRVHDGQVLTVDVDDPGGVAAADLTVVIRLRQVPTEP